MKIKIDLLYTFSIILGKNDKFEIGLYYNNNDGWSGVFFKVGMIIGNWYREENLKDKDKLTILRIMG